MQPSYSNSPIQNPQFRRLASAIAVELDGLSLQDVIYNDGPCEKTVLACFRKFLEEALASEQLEFLCAVQAWYSCPSAASFGQLVRTYIDSGSEKWVVLPAPLQRELRARAQDFEAAAAHPSAAATPPDFDFWTEEADILQQQARRDLQGAFFFVYNELSQSRWQEFKKILEDALQQVTVLKKAARDVGE